ncbi:MAG: YbaK/EbsC family protein [Proteobacteria bacterium]|nr:YbaK/EbsC family protein [Pseudomonadota bacterium]
MKKNLFKVLLNLAIGVFVGISAFGILTRFFGEEGAAPLSASTSILLGVIAFGCMGIIVVLGGVIDREEGKKARKKDMPDGGKDGLVLGEKELISALEERGCEPVISRFERSTETARAASEELGVGVERIVKSIVLSAAQGPVIALLPGNRRVDLKKAAGVLGAGKVRLADPESVLEWTGYPVGAVPPLGHRKRLPVLMDGQIPAEGFIFPSAGETTNVFKTTFQELERLTGAQVCGISKEQEEGRKKKKDEG